MKEAKTLEELREIYTEELARKDALIKKLREENTLLMKMSMRSSQEKIDLRNKIHALDNDLS